VPPCRSEPRVHALYSAAPIPEYTVERWYTTIETYMDDILQVPVSRSYLTKLCTGVIKAQYCWAHLIRDIRFLQKHPHKKTKAWADDLLDRSRRLFSAWHRREKMIEAGFHQSMITHRDRFLELVRNPPDCKEAANLAARFEVVDVTDGSTYDMSQDYFRFMFEPHIEPTNNHSEQQVRHCVIDRRITQGVRSAVGERYHERMWTAIATCTKQNRSFFDFLHASITAQLNAQSSSSLIN